MNLMLNGDWIQIDLETTPERELRRIRLALQEERDGIRTELDMAKRQAAHSGDYSDPQWFTRAEAALRHKRRQIAAIEDELALRDGQHETTVDSYFVDIARRRLKETVFEEMWQEAQDAAQFAEEILYT